MTVPVFWLLHGFYFDAADGAFVDAGDVFSLPHGAGCYYYRDGQRRAVIEVKPWDLPMPAERTA